MSEKKTESPANAIAVKNEIKLRKAGGYTKNTYKNPARIFLEKQRMNIAKTERSEAVSKKKFETI